MDPATKRSSTGDYFTNKFTTGRLSSVDVAEGAACVAKDVAPPPDVERQGRSYTSKERVLRDGTVRLDSRNTSRGVRRALASRHTNRLPGVTFSIVPLWDLAAGRTVMGLISIMLPHSCLDALPLDGNEEELCELGPSHEELAQDRRDWAGTSGVKLEYDPPVATCGLWADAAPYTSKDSAHLRIMKLFSGPGSHGRACSAGKRMMGRYGCGGRCTIQ